MGNRRLLNLILLCLVLAAAAAVLLSRREAPPPHPVLSRLHPGSVDRIRVERRGKPALAFARREGGWRMTAPAAAAANPARIRSLLQLAVTRPRARLAAGSDPGPLGLDPAPVSVYLNNRAFRLGGTDPVDGLRYVLHHDNVYLIEDTLFQQLLQPPAFFVDRRLLPGGSAVTRIAYPDRELIRDGNTWRGRSAADLVRAWRQAAAQRVETYGGEKGAGTITVATGSSAITFTLVPAGPALLLARPDLGIAYRLSAPTATALELAGYIHGEPAQ